MKLAAILVALDPETILINTNGEVYDAANLIDYVTDDMSDYTIDGDGIWRLVDGFRESMPTYRLGA